MEAGVDPLFTVLTAPQADRLYARAFQAWLQETLKNPPDGVRRALARTSFGPDRDGPIDRLRNAGRTLAEWRPFPQAWARPTFDRAAAVDDVVAQQHQLADLTSAPSYERDSLYIDTAAVRRLSRQIRLEASFGQRNLGAWEARLIDLGRDRGITRTRKGSGARFGKDVSRTEVLAARDTLYGALLQFRRDADADLAAALQQELAGATAGYQELKAAAGALDFTDLLARARDLIRDDEPVRTHLQKKFVRIFVDEFQDTDPIQAEILLLLADNAPGRLFIVGDPKQAIYRFRGTDVGTYWDVSRELAAKGDASAADDQLPERAGDPALRERRVLEEMTADERRSGGIRAAVAIPRPTTQQPAVVAPRCPRHAAAARPCASRRRRSSRCPTRWADSSNGCSGSGWTIDGKPIQPRDMRSCSAGSSTSAGRHAPPIDAIEARGIARLLIGGKAFHGRRSGDDPRRAGRHRVAGRRAVGVLDAEGRSSPSTTSICSIPAPLRDVPPVPRAEELGGNSGGDLVLTGEPTARLMPIAIALRLLQQLHRGATIARRGHVGRLLAETRAHVGFILRPAGEQALATCCTSQGWRANAPAAISFRGFIDGCAQPRTRRRPPRRRSSRRAATACG